MYHLEKLKALEDRAALVNVSLHTLCQQAGVGAWQLQRWRKERVSPQARVFERDMQKLSDALDAIEARIFASLAAKFHASPDKRPRPSRSRAA